MNHGVKGTICVLAIALLSTFACFAESNNVLVNDRKGSEAYNQTIS